MAASFTRDSMAAPARPSDLSARESSLASVMSLARGTCLSRRCTRRMARRPRASGRSTRTRRSKRPGRSKASSRTSGLLVAPITTTGLPERASKPSMDASIWFNVCSASWFPPDLRKSPPPRARSASISSMKTMHGACFLARSKRLRTRAAPRPTKSSTNSVAATLTKGTPASAAQARAKSVLPDPGGPMRRTPRGTRAPSTE
mmetsp:Transcript_43842/g.95454  ORF Transcript_43842/g.95454 Transcript_43842/m.95454 type:complete len:203 (+) Transcript_43842:339-947(+)